MSDLSSFDTVKLSWSRLPLRRIDQTTVQNPHVNAGQSGCFLPAGPNGDPGVFLLFGGISPISGTCVDDLCVISPDRGRWFTVTPTTYVANRPAGRCGHSVCALDSRRALVMFGNLESFMAPSFDASTPAPYRGQPAGDMWILTRCSSPCESSQGGKLAYSCFLYCSSLLYAIMVLSNVDQELCRSERSIVTRTAQSVSRSSFIYNVSDAVRIPRFSPSRLDKDQAEVPVSVFSCTVTFVLLIM